MSNEHYDILVDVFCSVFEQMAFMFGEPVELDDIESNSEEYIKATMSFGGDMKGKMEMIIEKNMCSVIASNVLGIDPEDEKAHILGFDSFKEMLNVICGQCLTTIAGEEPVFNLSVPEIEELDVGKWRKHIDSKLYIPFDMDEYPVLLNFSIH